ncbi:glycosyltransferase [Microbacterium oxydans]|nr:glycosyltransferase [Microbacterium oxydans]
MTPAATARILIGVTADVSIGLLSGLPQRLVADGWEVHVASSPGERLEALATSPGVSVHPLPMAREIDIVGDVRGLRDWMRLIRRLRPDVVFVGTPKAGLLGITAARLLGVRTRVYHLRGLRLETAAGDDSPGADDHGASDDPPRDHHAGGESESPTARRVPAARAGRTHHRARQRQLQRCGCGSLRPRQHGGAGRWPPARCPRHRLRRQTQPRQGPRGPRRGLPPPWTIAGRHTSC